MGWATAMVSAFRLASQGRPPAASAAPVGQKPACYCSMVFLITELLNSIKFPEIHISLPKFVENKIKLKNMK
jgi:hypothetical protein